jgi:hypothetical protein
MPGASEPAGGFMRVFSADDLRIKTGLETEKLRQTVSFRGNSGDRYIWYTADRLLGNTLILNQYQLHFTVPYFFGIKLVLALNLIAN